MFYNEKLICDICYKVSDETYPTMGPVSWTCQECIDKNKKTEEIKLCSNCHESLGETFFATNVNFTSKYYCNECGSKYDNGSFFIVNKNNFEEMGFGENTMAKKSDFIKFDNLEEMIVSINKKSINYKALFLTHNVKNKDILFQSFEELYSLDITFGNDFPDDSDDPIDRTSLCLRILDCLEDCDSAIDLDGYPPDSKIGSIWDDIKHLSDCYDEPSNKVQEIGWDYNKYDNLPVDKYDPSLNIKNGKKTKKKKIKEINFRIFLDKIKKIDLYDWGIIFRTDSHFDAFAVFEFLDKSKLLKYKIVSTKPKKINLNNLFPEYYVGKELKLSEDESDDNLIASWSTDEYDAIKDSEIEKILNKANTSGTDRRDNAIFDMGQSDVDIGL